MKIEIESEKGRLKIRSDGEPIGLVESLARALGYMVGSRLAEKKNIPAAEDYLSAVEEIVKTETVLAASRKMQTDPSVVISLIEGGGLPEDVKMDEDGVKIWPGKSPPAAEGIDKGTTNKTPEGRETASAKNYKAEGTKTNSIVVFPERIIEEQLDNMSPDDRPLLAEKK